MGISLYVANIITMVVAVIDLDVVDIDVDVVEIVHGPVDVDLYRTMQRSTRKDGVILQ